jgi:hypothetical protein
MILYTLVLSQIFLSQSCEFNNNTIKESMKNSIKERIESKKIIENHESLHSAYKEFNDLHGKTKDPRKHGIDGVQMKKDLLEKINNVIDENFLVLEVGCVSNGSLSSKEVSFGNVNARVETQAYGRTARDNGSKTVKNTTLEIQERDEEIKKLKEDLHILQKSVAQYALSNHLMILLVFVLIVVFIYYQVYHRPTVPDSVKKIENSTDTELELNQSSYTSGFMYSSSEVLPDQDSYHRIMKKKINRTPPKPFAEDTINSV